MYFSNCYFAFFANVCLDAQSTKVFSVHFNQVFIHFIPALSAYRKYSTKKNDFCPPILQSRNFFTNANKAEKRGEK